MGRQALREVAARRGGKGKARKPGEITASRINAIEQMNGPLKRKFGMIERSVNDLRADNLRYYHKIGTICREIKEKPTEYQGKDGTSGLKLIEQALSTQARTLRKAASFAEVYDDDQLERLIGMVNTETNFQLNWGHVSFLLSLPTPEKRDHFAQQAVEKMLDPPALHELIKKKTHRSAGHGRKHEMPKTIPAQIRQILTFCRQWVAKNKEVWNGEEESVYGNLLNMNVEDMEPDMVDQLQEISDLMQQISDTAEQNVAKTNAAKEHLDASIKQREQEAENLRETGKQARSIELDETTPAPRRRGRRSTAAAST